MQINYFHPLKFGMTVTLFAEKFYRVKGRLFKQNVTFDHLYLLTTKSKKIIPNVKLLEFAFTRVNMELIQDNHNTRVFELSLVTFKFWGGV